MITSSDLQTTQTRSPRRGDEQLRKKRQNSSNADEWLSDYLEKAYVPSHDDFRCLRKYVKKYRRIYQSNYDPIRDRIYAHKEYAASSDKHDLFARTKILELEKLFAFLNHVYGILWELYFNGRAPQLKRISFSSARLLRDRAPRYMSHTVQEDIAAEVQGFLYGVSGP